MTKLLKYAGLAVAGLVVGLLVHAGVQNNVNLGGVYNTSTKYFPQGLKAGPADQFEIGTDGTTQIGTSGTALTRVNAGTCYIMPYATTIAASSSVIVDCQGRAAISASGFSALTGVSFGDSVQITLSTTTATQTAQGSLTVEAAAASTTSGSIVLYLYNNTGATYTWPLSGVASGTASFIAID